MKDIAIVAAAGLLCLASCSVLRPSAGEEKPQTSYTIREHAWKGDPDEEDLKVKRGLDDPEKDKGADRWNRGAKAEQNGRLAAEEDSEVGQILSYGHKFMGTRYRFGGTTPAGFDCSGFTSYIFGKYGISLSHSSGAQYSETERLGISEIRPGDLVFFEGRSHNGRVGHVAVIETVDGESFTMLHATVAKGVTLDTYPDGGYYSSRLIGFGRVAGLE